MQNAEIKGRGARFGAAAVGGGLGKYRVVGSGACERGKRPGNAFNLNSLQRKTGNLKINLPSFHSALHERVSVESTIVKSRPIKFNSIT